MISESFKALPDNYDLRRICKAVSVIDAILAPACEKRYYTYNAHWGEGEELFEISNGEGDQLLILFREDGCIINGFCHESKQPSLTEITKDLPPVFNQFIFGEPVKSIGTSFCIWTYEKSKWHFNYGPDSKICMNDMFAVFDGKTQTYINWANEYYSDCYKEPGIPPHIVNKIYKGEPLTREMTLGIVETIEDWDHLQSEMEQIDYITHFKIK